MAFRPRFDCLWCGQTWETRSPDDLEGWAALCPDCLGRADDNGFLRMRLRMALRERAASAAADVSAQEPLFDSPGAWDDWYLRRGGFSRGPVHDGPWSMELDEATRWLDGLPLSGLILELGAGMGWWTGLLAEKGELWVHDDDAASLDAARKRLLAHGLLAHLHERDPLSTPDKQVDAVFAAYLLSRAGSPGELDARFGVARAWLKPGGHFVFIEAGPGVDDAPVAGPDGLLLPHDPATLRDRALVAGFDSVQIEQTRSAFVLGHAITAASGR